MMDHRSVGRLSMQPRDQQHESFPPRLEASRSFLGSADTGEREKFSVGFLVARDNPRRRLTENVVVNREVQRPQCVVKQDNIK